MNNTEITKLIIAEKDKIRFEYKQKLNQIKQHYGVEFDIDHFKSGAINNINFINLKYKNSFENVTVVYDYTSRKFNYIDYEFIDSRTIKGINHKKLLSSLEKEYKLRLIVGEIERINNDYIYQLKLVEEIYENNSNTNLENSKELKIRKNDEN